MQGVFNKKNFEKWQKAHLPQSLFERFPRFVDFLFKSNLVSQIKITRKIAATLQDNEPALLVEGKWVKETDLYRRFEIQYSHQFKQPFLVEKQSGDVYTFLDNGQGLEKRHPYLSPPDPISTLSKEEFYTLRNRANLFVRPEEQTLSATEKEQFTQNRPHVLQIVTATEKRGSTNFHKAITNPRHVYSRVIFQDDQTGAGKVYEFGLERGRSFVFPLSMNTTRLRSPEIRNHFPNDEMIVTSIPVSSEEAHAIRTYCTNYHQANLQTTEPVSYHITYQNCTVFVREACKAAGIDIPTEMSIPEIVSAITPDWMNRIGLFFTRIKGGIFNLLEKPLSKKVMNWIRTISDKITTIWTHFYQTVASICLFPFRFVLGDAFGSSGLAFHQRFGQRFIPPLQNLRTYLDFRIHAPMRVKQWQEEQASTVVFQKPVRLAI